nr:Coq4 family protein [uncultured Psychroserpens sp.]
MNILQTHRKNLITWLFKHTQNVYTKFFKSNDAWGISREELLAYPHYSFGKHLGDFLNLYGFELIAKVERHDAYHTLTGYGTKVEDEIALQCLCYGNGKRSLYLYGAMILGIIILPDYFKYYIASYSIGKRANPFHQFDYEQLLHVNIDDFRDIIFVKREQKHLIFN